MSVGLIGLLDDIAAIAKVAAASLDDVASQAAKAGAKAAGVVIDDTAVTPGYVIGFEPKRELPIVGKIAAGSLRNKLLILLPAALVLSYFLPWTITPLLMLGGASGVIGLLVGAVSIPVVEFVFAPAWKSLNRFLHRRQKTSASVKSRLFCRHCAPSAACERVPPRLLR